MNSQESNLLSTTDDHIEIDPELALEQTLADPDLIQHIVRTNRDGVDTVVGYFRCHFSEGQQRHVLHCSFNPPFEQLPTIDAMVTCRDDVRARITDCQKFGTRIELIFREPCLEETKLLVEVIASSSIA